MTRMCLLFGTYLSKRDTTLETVTLYTICFQTAEKLVFKLQFYTISLESVASSTQTGTLGLCRYNPNIIISKEKVFHFSD